MSTRFIFPLILIFLSLNARSQLSLTGTSYFQNFDSLRNGLPVGWTVRISATDTSRGSAESFNTRLRSWASRTGEFRNSASADATGLTVASSTTDQDNAVDRALAIRQTGSFGDPGAAIELELKNTTGFFQFELSMKHLMLDVERRSAVWQVQYSINGTQWDTLGSPYLDPGIWGVTNGRYSFGNALDNISSAVYIRIVSLNRSSGTGSRDTYGIDDVELTWDNVPVPVSWLAFEGKALAVKNVLTWSTAQEVDNSHFLIERAGVDRQFRVIGRVEGHGTVSEITTYQFTDFHPIDDAIYQLRQIDFDGSFDYSSKIRLKRKENETSGGFKVYPNPTSKSFQVRLLDGESPIDLIMYDLNGQLIKSWKKIDQRTVFDITDLPEGVFWIEVYSDHQFKHRKMILINH